MFVSWDDFHPFFEALPLPEKNKKIVLTYFVESFDLIEPFLDWNKLSRLWIYKFADSFTTEGVVILYLLAYYFRVSHNFHIIVVILIFAYHVDELVSCELLLPYHFKKRSYLVVRYLDLTWMWFRGH